MAVARINPSAEYKQDELSRIQQNLARAIETTQTALQPSMLIPVGMQANATLATSTSNPTPLLFNAAIQWYTVMPFAGKIISFSAYTSIGSGGPVAFFIVVNGTVVFNIPVPFTGNQSYQFTLPVTFAVNDNVQVYTKSATASTAASVSIFAHLEIVKGG